jgi:hypothetical protein
MPQGEQAGEMAGAVAGAVAEPAALAPTELPAGSPPIAPGGTAVQRVGYAPIVRLDTARREIELCATSEAVDSYGTIFDYDASKKAFARWIGNVREMHERKAVGRRVGVRFDEGTKKVFVTIRISRGAQDTWEKVLDGTLRGASIGASNVQWKPTLAGILPEAPDKSVMRAIEYDLVELSLVDNPSNPDALGITFVRDATPDLVLLDQLEEESAAEVVESAELTQRGERQAIPVVNGRGTRTRDESYANGARACEQDAQEQRSATETESGTQAAQTLGARLPEAARAVLAGCGCAVCAAAMAILDDGSSEEDTGEESRAEVERGEGMAMGWREASRLREASLARALGASLRVSAGRLERLDAGLHELRAAMRDALREVVHEGVGQIGARVDQATSQMAAEMAAEMAAGMATEMARTAQTTGELRQRVERLEAQPMPGGPAARAVEKTHALHISGSGPAGQASAAEQYRALEALAGRLADPQAQIAVAAELIRLQRAEAAGHPELSLGQESISRRATYSPCGVGDSPQHPHRTLAEIGRSVRAGCGFLRKSVWERRLKRPQRERV